MPLPKLDMPFQPLRKQLYTSTELMMGYDAVDPDSMRQTLDFRTYRYFVTAGGAAPSDPYAGMMEALHDNAVMRAMGSFLQSNSKPVVAIMGGHDESRDSQNYADIVEIARRLTRQGFLIASGGGPGAMEATHLGAMLANASDAQVNRALKSLSVVPKLPDVHSLISAKTGRVSVPTLHRLHEWVKPAFALAKRRASSGAMSLAVPTWYYGNEPTTPFATHIAKYFQNSIREDVLLGLAANGIIYAEGKAGTLQEVFQDAAQNFYRKKNQPFAPMIFFRTSFWRSEFDVIPLLHTLFVVKQKMPERHFKRLVTTADDIDDTVTKLVGHAPTKEKTAAGMAAVGLGHMLTPHSG